MRDINVTTMGTTHSHETATAVLGHNQTAHKSYKSAAIPPLQGPKESDEAPCPLPTVCPGKIKLNGLAAGDVTTCCTTTCNSSLSGVSASPETCSTGFGVSANAVTITLSSGSPLQRSDSALAVSSIAEQSPRAFSAVPELDDVEANATRAATRNNRWSYRNPRVQGFLKTLRRGAIRSSSQPPPGSRSHAHPDVLAAANERASFAAALHAHILREEEEHRRRQNNSNLPKSNSEISTPQTQLRCLSPPELFEDNHSYVPPSGYRAKIATSWRSSLEDNEATFSLEGAETQEIKRSGQGVVRTVGGRRALEPSYRGGVTASRWIADVPTNGRWEMERGEWNRQGVHLNHLGVVDERFKALAATRRLSPRHHATQPQGWCGAMGQDPEAPLPQPRRVPIAPLAGRLQENQQRLLQWGHQVVPVTHRGVAAATTIELARIRHANEEKRRQQHSLIASPEPEQGMPAATGIHRKQLGVTCSAHPFSTGKDLLCLCSVQETTQAVESHAMLVVEMKPFCFGELVYVTGREEGKHDCAMGSGPTSTRNLALHGRGPTETSVPAHCFCQAFTPRERYSGRCLPSTRETPTLLEAGGCREARKSSCSDSAPELPVSGCEQQRQQVRSIPATNVS